MGLLHLLDVDTTVEARYKGKSKYYKGKISRARSDGTYDINYDDGEKEQNVKRSYIKVVEEKSSSRSSRSKRRSRSPSQSASDSDSHRRSKSKLKSKSRSKSKSRRSPSSGSVSSDNNKKKSSKKKKKSKKSSRRSRSPSQSSSSSSSDASDGGNKSNRDRERQQRLKRFNRDDDDSSSRKKKIMGDFSPGDVIECCYYRSKNASKYTKPKKQSKYYSAKIKRFNSEGTYTIEYTSHNFDMIDNVPPKYVRDPDDADNSSASNNSDSSSNNKKSKKRSRSWEAVTRLAHHDYEYNNSRGPKPSLTKATKECRRDDFKKLEILLGRDNIIHYQDTFEQFDSGRNDELEYEEVTQVSKRSEWTFCARLVLEFKS